tara:strand:+ start:33357 stop:33956 length:600 start_codon:yes stop_codon:yes gene_type:complete
MKSKWHVVITFPKRENEVSRVLEKYNLICYNPLVKIPNSLEIEDVYTPLFPGYLFAKPIDTNHKLPSISHINGVYGWLKFNDEIPFIDDEIISEIKKTIFKLNSSYGLWSNYETGEKVIIEKGKLSEFAEIIENAKSPYENAKVLMHFMGRKIPALVPWSSIKPIKSSNVKNNRRLTRGRGRKIRNPDNKFKPSMVLQK